LSSEQESVILRKGDVVLDESIQQDILQIYDKLDTEGRLLSKTQLLSYYETFRRRFGPDKLVNLDGEALLKTIHGPAKTASCIGWSSRTMMSSQRSSAVSLGAVLLNSEFTTVTKRRLG